MRVSHDHPALSATFDDPNLVSYAGLAPALALAHRAGLADLVGHLGVLDEREMPLDGEGGEVAPGLRFVGFVYRPGLTGYVGRTARRVARDIAASQQSPLAARLSPSSSSS